MSDAAAWDARYAEGAFAFGEAPNRYLESLLPRLRPGMRALALADGEGRNGVWLARQGLSVTAVDWSTTGIAKARALAVRHGVAPDLVTADLTRWETPAAAFDLVAWIFLHLPPADRAVVAATARRALAPGGLLVLECFSPAQKGRRSGGPRDPALLWTADLVREHFAGLEILECLQGTVLLDEGPKHQGHAEVVRALLRKAP
ncbi:SAM-dependent methyltransferase [Roseomonas sp. CCTCC AB2023176]|uniref:SAM-dependent methyltransferase n=1 Tax=Roseomonas sp. CCTCC AB2023176 TaxID=3342640 RepID=UPI0035E1F7E4